MNEQKKPFILSILVPVYNEQENIFPFYERTKGVLEKICYDFEMIYINDGSNDNTLIQIRKLSEKDPRVKGIDLSRNFGKEIALSAGIDYSIGDGVIPMDVDLQDPPEVIPTLVAKWQEGYDVVYATRTRREGETWFKKLTATWFYKVIQKLTRFNIPADTGDFRLMDKTVVDALKLLKENHRFMKGLFSWVGYRQTGIKYVREPRTLGLTKWNYMKLFNLAFEGITSFSHFPLKMATVTGVIVSLSAIGYGIFMMMRTLIYGNPVPGYPSLITAVLFLGGIQLLALGIIGEYIGRIYNESKRRPLYLVRQVFNGIPKQPGKNP